MSQSREANNLSKVIKCWIYVPVADHDINDQADKWQEAQAVRWFGVKGVKREYQIIKSQAAFASYVDSNLPTKVCLNKVEKNDILYVYCHGYLDPQSFNSTREIGGLALINKKHIEVRISPAQLVDHLHKAGLKADHKLLKLFSCYSSEIVCEISGLMQKKWPGIEIHGYKGETIPAGPNFSKLAGLTHKEAELYSSLDEEITNKVNNGDFKAKAHRVEYKSGQLLNKDLSDSKEEAVSEEKILNDLLSEGVAKLKL
ncbi:MAG TPA: hypothetical protein VHA13_05475 [Gammaproteobacteria bacterium]|nr:hypothetical protein [Gammaproteobacteria bacterium]